MATDMAQPAAANSELIFNKELQAKLRVTDMTIRAWEKDPKVGFPKRIKFGRQRVAWLRSEVEAWWAARLAQREAGTTQA